MSLSQIYISPTASYKEGTWSNCFFFFFLFLLPMRRRRERWLLRWQENPLWEDAVWTQPARAIEETLIATDSCSWNQPATQSSGSSLSFLSYQLGLLHLPLTFWGIGCHHHPWLPVGSSSILLSPLLNALNKPGSYSSLKNHLKEPFLFTIGHDWFYCWSSWMVFLSTALKNWQNHFSDISWT